MKKNDRKEHATIMTTTMMNDDCRCVAAAEQHPRASLVCHLVGLAGVDRECIAGITLSLVGFR
eukprot:scaffold528_cov165-Amphora_coffeaeformis.AAC.42